MAQPKENYKEHKNEMIMTKEEFDKLPEVSIDMLKEAKVGDVLKVRHCYMWKIVEVTEYLENESHCRECAFGGCGLCDLSCYYYYRPDGTNVWFKYLDKGYCLSH